MYGTTGQHGKALEAAEKEIEYARAASDFRLETRGAVAYALAAPYGPIPVEAAIGRCEELASEVSSDRRSVALINQRLAYLCAMHGDFEHARSLATGARAMLLEIGAGVLSHATSLDSARVEMLAGDLTAAAGQLERDYEALGELGEKYVRSSIGGLLARVYAMQQRDDEAFALSQDVEANAAEDDVDPQALWRAARGLVLARRGEAAEALRLAEEALALRMQSDSPVEQAEALTDLAEIKQAAGDLDGAIEALQRARDLLTVKGDLPSVERLTLALEGLRAADPKQAASA
jgi:tetratricopeptide (TPR) repeat protein